MGSTSKAELSIVDPLEGLANSYSKGDWVLVSKDDFSDSEDTEGWSFK